MTFSVRACLLLSCGLGVCSPVVAQEIGTVPTEQSPDEAVSGEQARNAAPTADTQSNPTDEEAALGEIVVTAQKRRERIQDVPIAIRAVTGDQIVAGGISSLTALTRAVPDLQIDNQTIFTVLTIRGVSSRDVFIANDSAVSVNIDGEYVNRPIGLNVGFFDVERIEVLRGPQGTLYGRNSTGGAINIFANKPGKDFGATADVEVGNYNTVSLQGTLNVPVNDTLSLRFAGMHAQRDGFRNNKPAGRGDDQNNEGARVSLLWKPVPAITAYLAGEYIDIDQTPPEYWGYQFGPTEPGWTPGEAPRDFVTDLPRRKFPLESLGNQRVKQYVLRGRVDADVGLGTLTYSGGYRDTDGSAIIQLNGYVPQLFTFHHHAQDSKVQSHELRLSGDFAGRGAWQFGGFLSRDDVRQEGGLFLDFIPAYADYDFRDYLSKSKAIFGQASIPLVEQLQLTVGARQTWDEKSGDFLKAGFSPTLPSETDPGLSEFVFDEKWSKFTWHTGIEWKPTRDNLVYAKVSTGYKAGGVNIDNIFDPETVTSYEVGTKNTFAGGKLLFNASAFYYDYKDQQVSVLEDIAVGAVTRNAGKSIIKGIETDLKYAFTRDDVLSLTVNYLDAKYDRFDDAVEPVLSAPNRPVDLSGNRAAQAPKWTIVGGFDKTIRFANGGKVTGGITSTYKSAYFMTPFNWRLERQKGHTITDASIVYYAPGETWRLGAFVRNLEDNVVISSASFLGGGIDLWNFNFGARRTFGLQAGYRF